MITHNQLVYLVEVVKERNFTRAAENLFVSQSTLSKSLKMLEAELGVEIIRRDSKNFALTEEGKEVYAFAQRVLSYLTAETESLKQQLHGVPLEQFYEMCLKMNREHSRELLTGLD